MRLADARLAASIINPCSQIECWVGRVWLCMMKTSEPRMVCPNRHRISLLGKSIRSGLPRETPRCSATSSANGRLVRPENSWRRFFVTVSTVTAPSYPS